MVELIRRPRKKGRIHFIPSRPRAWTGREAPSIEPAELVEGRLLSAVEESACFRRMNFLKERAASIVENGADLIVDGEVGAAALLDDALQIRNGLARVFLGLAIGLARRFANHRFAVDELVSEANLTLLQAIENFDADLGFRFSTYATRAVRRNIYRYMIKQRERAVRETPVECLAETPDHRAVAVEFDLDAPTSAEVRKIVGELRERDAYIVRRRFGLFPEGDEFTLQRVADELGVTRERVRQLENRALRELRSLACERFAGMMEA